MSKCSHKRSVICFRLSAGFYQCLGTTRKETNQNWKNNCLHKQNINLAKRGTLLFDVIQKTQQANSNGTFSDCTSAVFPPAKLVCRVPHTSSPGYTQKFFQIKFLVSFWKLKFTQQIFVGSRLKSSSISSAIKCKVFTDIRLLIPFVIHDQVHSVNQTRTPRIGLGVTHLVIQLWTRNNEYYENLNKILLAGGLHKSVRNILILNKWRPQQNVQISNQQDPLVVNNIIDSKKGVTEFYLVKQPLFFFLLFYLFCFVFFFFWNHTPQRWFRSKSLRSVDYLWTDNSKVSRKILFGNCGLQLLYRWTPLRRK